MPQRGTLLRWLTALTGVVVLGCSGLAITVGRADPAGPALIFYDDFDGPAGARPADHWRYDVGGGGWGNNEMQVYTDHPDNVSLDGAGHLAISARREADGVITSARVTTKGTMEFTTGRVEARIAFPAGTGLHSALWLLGSNIDTVGWPECGEIDVMEALNAVTQFHTGVHAPKTGGEGRQEFSAAGPAPFPLAGEFHTYWVDRTPGRIVTGIDEMPLLTVTAADLSPDARWVFDAPFYLLMNLAVGGNWPGRPDASTPDPSTMLVDWVRVVAA